MNEVMLDDAATYTKYDPSEMGKRIRELPTVILDAWQAAINFELPDDFKGVNKVLILGMGGSAIGGDLVRRLLLHESKAPITVLGNTTCRHGLTSALSSSLPAIPAAPKKPFRLSTRRWPLLPRNWS